MTTYYNWLKISDGATARYDYAAAAIGSTLYVFGGVASDGSDLGDFWVYNSAPDIWSELSSDLSISTTYQNFKARHGLSAATISSDLYIFGGFDGSNYKNDLYSYNGFTWLNILASQNKPLIRVYHTAVTIESDMLVFGGRNSNTVFSDLHQFDGSAWSTLTPGATPRYKHTAVTIGTQMFVFAGLNQNGSDLNDLWMYDTTTSDWRHLSDGAPPRHSHAAAALGSDMYIFGGVNNSGVEFSDLWQYNTATHQWTKLFTSGAITARNGHAMVNVNGEILVFGGTSNNSDTGAMKDLWMLSLSNLFPSIVMVAPSAGTAVVQGSQLAVNFIGVGAETHTSVTVSLVSYNVGFAGVWSDNTSDDGSYTGSFHTVAPVTIGTYALTLASTAAPSVSCPVSVIPLLSDISGHQTVLQNAAFNACFYLNAPAVVTLMTGWGYSDTSDFTQGQHCFSLTAPAVPSDYTYTIESYLSDLQMSVGFSDVLSVITAPPPVNSEKKSSGRTAIAGLLAGVVALSIALKNSSNGAAVINTACDQLKPKDNGDEHQILIGGSVIAESRHPRG